MKLTLTASTGAKILVWREGDVFAAGKADSIREAQICLGVDLFEVIAELAGLELEDETQATEASELAAQAQQTLIQMASSDGRPEEGLGRSDASERG